MRPTTTIGGKAVKDGREEVGHAVATRLTGRLDELVRALEKANRPLFANDRDAATSISTLQAMAFIRSIDEQRLLTPFEIENIRIPSREINPFQVQRILWQAVRIVWQEAAAQAKSLELAADEQVAFTESNSVLMLCLTHQLALATLSDRLTTPAIASDADATPLTDLVGAQISDDRRAEAAKALRIDQSHPHAIVTFGLRKGDDETSLHDVEKLVRMQLGHAGFAGEIVGDTVVFVVRMRSAGNPAEEAEAIATFLEPSDIVAGLGRSYGTLNTLPTSYRQSLQALDVAMLEGTPPVLTYSMALPFELILGNPSTALEIMHTVLDPLISYDETNSTNLVETMEVFIASSHNYSRAAERLHIHRHSLHDRMLRIEQLTGRRVERQDDLLLFDLATRVMRLARSD